MTESGFEARIERGLRQMADEGLRPFDPRALAEVAVSQRSRWRFLGAGDVRPRMVLLAAALLLASLVGVAALLGKPGPVPTRPLPLVTTEQLIFVRGGDIWIADANGLNARLLAAHERGQTGPRGLRDIRWSQDGARIMTVTDSDPFRFDAPPHVRILAADGTSIGSFDLTGVAPQQPLAWSPDGTHLAVLEAETADGGLWLYDETGRLEREITLPAAYRAAMPTIYANISWSPDGRSLALNGCPCNSETNGGWIVPVDGSAARQVPFPGDGNPATLAWSPDGTRLAVGSSHWSGSLVVPPDGPGEIWVMGLDGSSSQRLVVSEPALAVAGWSHDGMWIAYGGRTTAGPAIDVVRANGGGDPVRMGLLKGPIVWSFEQNRPFFMPEPTGTHPTDGGGAMIVAGDPEGGPVVVVIDNIDFGPFDLVWPGH